MESTPSPNTGCPAVLPPDLIGRCLELLNPNDMAFHGRLVNQDACRRFCDPLHRTATFSIPLPPKARETAWQQYMLQAFQQLTFGQKLMSLSVAAASGSQRNLELAWALLQPCVSLGYVHAYITKDAGTAAVRFGHLHLLPWLLQHGCPVGKHSVLEAAAQHCDMQQLLHVWGLLGYDAHPPSGGQVRQIHARLAQAAGISGAGAVAKLSWLLAVYKAQSPNPKLTEREMVVAAAEGAAESGNLPVLRWLLQERDPTLCSNTLAELWEEDGSSLPKWPEVLSSALRHRHVAVADWLVDEAGCPVLQRVQEQQEEEVQQRWELWQLWHGAAGGGSVEAMRWLLRRGVPVCREAIGLAAESGRLEAVRFLHEECRMDLQQDNVFSSAAGSGSVPLATWLLQAGCPMSRDAYGSAAGAGHGAMVTWLAREARCPWGRETQRDVLHEFWSGTRDTSVGEGSSNDPQIEQAVWAMLDAGCPPGGGTDRADSIGAAAQLGYLDLVRHLRDERGVAFAPGTLAAAARGGCVPVVEWLVGAGCRAGPGADNDPYVVAAGGEDGQGIADVATLSCLHRLGVPWNGGVLRWAVRKGVSWRVLRWMVEQGAPWDEATLQDKVADQWRRGKHDDENLAWFAERLGVYDPVAGSIDVG